MNATPRGRAGSIPLLLDPAVLLLDPAVIADMDRALATGTTLVYTFMVDPGQRVSRHNPSYTARFSVDRLPDGLYRLTPAGPITRRVR